MDYSILIFFQSIKNFSLSRWSHIAVDTVRVKHHETLHVIFVATLEGVVKKLIRPPGSSKTCVIEEIQVIAPEDSQTITAMKLLGDQVISCEMASFHLVWLPQVLGANITWPVIIGS